MARRASSANAATTDAGAYEWHEWDVYAVYAYANAGHEWDAHAYEWHDRHVYANARCYSHWSCGGRLAVKEGAGHEQVLVESMVCLDP